MSGPCWRTAQTAAAVDAIAASATGDSRYLKRTAITALRDMGESSRPALPVLRAIVANDPNGRARKVAQSAIDKIIAGEPARVQLDELRDELDKLRENNERLEDEIEKVKAKRETEHSTAS